ncbi:hypothetical protein AMJ86_07230 [bacterium SM23_57]|nr:MAG: hypothetical protein AMJ86_07230 [bacterium SM23_57]
MRQTPLGHTLFWINQSLKHNPEPNPSATRHIFAARETSSQNMTEKAAAKTKNMIDNANIFFLVLILHAPF